MLKVAFYEKEITPPLGCMIPGYFEVRLGSDVRDRLYVRAVVIQSDSETIALASLDGSSGVSLDLKKTVCDRVYEYVGIKPENVLVCNTHCHTGIPKEGMDLNEDGSEKQAAYFEIMRKLVADSIILAYKRLTESELYYNIGEVRGISFCRNYNMKNSTPQTNPGRLNPNVIGPYEEIDYELPVMFAKDKDGVPLGAIVNFACHPDCKGGTEYSGDYVSVLSAELKKVYGPDFVTVFLQGTSGNINHIDVSRKKDAPDHYRMMGRKIAGEVLKTIAFAEPIVGDDIVAKYEIIKIAPRDDLIEDESNIQVSGDNPLGQLLKNKEMCRKIQQDYDVPLQFFRVGDVKFFAFPCEIFCRFGLKVKNNADAPKRFIATLSNANYGYVPTQDLRCPTIYEGFPGASNLERDAGDIMADRLIEMGK